MKNAGKWGGKSAAVAAVSLLCLSVVSCNGLFTTSLGTNFKRDTADFFAKASVSELSDMTSSVKTEAEKKVLLEALGKKGDELKALTPQQKKDILDLAADTTLPIEMLIDAVEAATDAANNPGETDPFDILNKVLGGIPQNVDTTALSKLLSDKDVVGAGGAPIETVALATVALLAQAVRDDPVLNTPEKQKEAMEAIQNVISDAPEGSTPADIAASLEAAGVSGKTSDAISTISTVMDTINKDSVRKNELANFKIGTVSIGDLINGKGTR